MKRYSPKDIESKWQKYWDEQGTYVANLDSDKPKYFGFAMFNYPSGSSIHLGHAKNFTLPDILVRYKRQRGFEAYSPVGFDSFGLPAENYAIKTGQSPRMTTDEAIASYHTQYRAMGWSMDWSKEIDTSKPDYYKWTQWCFLQLHKDGLAYQKDSAQWWCASCKTVLADEQVFAGKCWRHDGDDDPLVTKKNLRQWFFKITDYADEILEATDDLNWTPWVKVAQKNWIGRKSGIEIIYRIDNIDGEDENIVCFTTRPDTNFGATFVVIAPEHPFAQRIARGEITPKNGQSYEKEVKTYTEQAMAKSELDRQKDGRKKTGVFTGFYVHNGLNNKKLPIWISDFVLAGFGTGAVVGVPGHDIRDFEFAQVFNIPIERVVTGANGDTSPITLPEQVQESSGTMVNSGFLDGMEIHAATEAMMDHMEAHGMGIKVVNYSVRDWLISRQRYWGAPIPIIHCNNCGVVPVPEDQLPVILPEVADYHPSGDGRSPLAKVSEWVNVPCPDCGKPAQRETDTMDGYVCSSWYPLRYIDPRNDQQAWDVELANKWMPVDFYNGGDHATAHLLYARFFTRFFYKKGLINNPEPFDRMYFHAKILAPDGTFFSKSKGNGIDPLEVINSGYGADALRTYISFIAPPDVESPWNNDGLPSCYRFLNRVWTLVQEYSEADPQQSASNENSTLLRAIHKAIKKVSDDIDAVKYNTAIAAMMSCVNELYKIKEADKYTSNQWQFVLESIVQLIAPFAPHIAEELWRDLGRDDSVHADHWPVLDEQYLVEETLKIAVQVNGKVRAEMEIEANASDEDVKLLALKQENVQRHLEGREPKKVMYITGKLVSIVV